MAVPNSFLIKLFISVHLLLEGAIGLNIHMKQNRIL